MWQDQFLSMFIKKIKHIGYTIVPQHTHNNDWWPMWRKEIGQLIKYNPICFQKITEKDYILDTHSERLYLTGILHVHCFQTFCITRIMSWGNVPTKRLLRRVTGGFPLTHWGRVTHICIGKLTIIGSENGLSPSRRKAIVWTNAGLLSIGILRTYFSEISIKVQQFSLKKMHLKVSSAK